jgi:hypothetical protein
MKATTTVSPLKSTFDPARKLPTSDTERRMPLRREAKQTSHPSWRSNPSAVPGASTTQEIANSTLTKAMVAGALSNIRSLPFAGSRCAAALIDP